METCDRCRYQYIGKDIVELKEGHIYCLYYSQDFDFSLPQMKNIKCKHYLQSICNYGCEYYQGVDKHGFRRCKRDTKYCPKEPIPAPIINCDGCIHAITYKSSDDTILCNINESDIDSLNKGSWWPNKGCSQHSNNRN